jgi:hypothetical protein
LAAVGSVNAPVVRPGTILSSDWILKTAGNDFAAHAKKIDSSGEKEIVSGLTIELDTHVSHKTRPAGHISGG